MTINEIYGEMAGILERGERAAVATIISGEGSTPRKLGTKMLILSDGATKGSIGGGIVEAQVRKYALSTLKTCQIQTVFFDFKSIKDPDTDTRCGGSMTVLIEPLIPPEPAIIFGGGHIGFAIYSILATINFNITIVDDRKLYASSKRFPLARRVIYAPFEKAFERLRIDENTYIIICTRAHKNDESCLRHAFQTPACYIGMLGSRSKVAAFKERLLKEGIPRRRLNHLHSPIGLDIGAQMPEEIAVSVAAELIQFRSKRFRGKD